MRLGVASMLGQMELGAVTAQADIGRQVRLEPMLECLLEPQPPIPTDGPSRVGDSEDRNDVGGHRPTVPRSIPAPRTIDAVPVLVLLNGPPASGESTISARLVDRRPLAPNLDIDVVRGHLGRWMDDPNAAGIVARALAIAMAKAHLVGGYDVIVPQFLGRPEFIDELSLLALDVGARFVEIALMIDRDLAQDAFDERSATARDQTRRDAAALVERSQADNAIGEMFDRYEALLEQRPCPVASK